MAKAKSPVPDTAKAMPIGDSRILPAGAARSPTDIGRFRRALVGAACLIASASLVACNRGREGTSPGSAGGASSAVGDDMKGVARATEKAAKDIGHATVDLGEKARKGLEDATNKAGGGARTPGSRRRSKAG